MDCCLYITCHKAKYIKLSFQLQKKMFNCEIFFAVMQNVNAYMERNFKGADYKPDRIKFFSWKTFVYYVDGYYHLDSTNH